MTSFFKRTALSAMLLASSALGTSLAAADLNIAMDQIFQRMDPHNSNYNVDYSVASGVLERLITFDKNMKLVPQLATEWEGSADANALRQASGGAFAAANPSTSTP